MAAAKKSTNPAPAVKKSATSAKKSPASAAPATSKPANSSTSTTAPDRPPAKASASAGAGQGDRRQEGRAACRGRRAGGRQRSGRAGDGRRRPRRQRSADPGTTRHHQGRHRLHQATSTPSSSRRSSDAAARRAGQARRPGRAPRGRGELADRGRRDGRRAVRRRERRGRHDGRRARARPGAVGPGPPDDRRHRRRPRAHRRRHLRLLDASRVSRSHASAWRRSRGPPSWSRRRSAGSAVGSDAPSRHDRDGRRRARRCVIAAVVVARRPAHQALGASTRSATATMAHVVGTLQLNLAFNSGMAFSRGARAGSGHRRRARPRRGRRPAHRRSGARTSPLVRGGCRPGRSAARSATCSTGCSAATGWFRGRVVDFIDLQWWPIFNVADMAIVVGGVLLILSTLRASSSADARSERRGDRDDPGRARRRAARPRRGPAGRREPGGGGGGGRRRGRDASTASSVTSGKERVAHGQPWWRSTRRRSRWPSRREPDADVEFVRRPRRRRRHRGRQAGRSGRAPGRRQPGTARSSTGCSPATPSIAGVGEPERPGIVHRLDAGTSGLLVVARTPEAADALVAQFAAHTAGRRYDALVWGHPRRRTASSTRRSAGDPGDPLRMAVVADGRPARTDYEVVRRLRRARPTWRCCRAGWRPGAPTRSGCTSRPSATRWSGDPATATAARRSGSTRPFLHAAELSFDHPTTGERGDVHEPAARRPRRRSSRPWSPPTECPSASESLRGSPHEPRCSDPRLGRTGVSGRRRSR